MEVFCCIRVILKPTVNFTLCQRVLKENVRLSIKKKKNTEVGYILQIDSVVVC